MPLDPLPIDDVLPQVTHAFDNAQAVVLRAPAGAGKTTRVPPALLDSGLAGSKKIVVLQPRRVAARATAARMARERGGKLGDEIGFRVRFESCVSSRTRLEVVTEGILLRQLLGDPFLEDVGCVVFDEFHERSLNSDLALGMVRQVQQSVRSDLKVLVMSATLTAEPIAKWLGNCPVVESQGRTFPIEIRHWPGLDRQPLAELVQAGVEEVLNQTRGDCLVFLPGVGEIRQARKELESLARTHDIELAELYGDLPPAQQDAVLSSATRRRIILATNVAETSLTIPGVTAVVDSGLARVLRYDERTGLDHLLLEPISKASADQRAGRAGRTGPGLCLRLWPEALQRTRSDFDEPEIRRVDLAPAVLQLKAWIEPDVESFLWFEPPAGRTLERATELLTLLDCLEAGAITQLGQQIAELPVHPRVGRLLLEGAKRGCLGQAATAAALLSERDPFLRQAASGPRMRTQVGGSDVATRVQAIEQFAASGAINSPAGALNPQAARSVLRVREQLLRLVPKETRAPRQGDAYREGEAPAEPSAGLLRCLLAAYPDRLVRRRAAGSERGLMVGGRGVALDPASEVRDAELFLAIVIDGGESEGRVRQASAVRREWLAASHLARTVEVYFDEASEKVVARARTRWQDLTLEETNAPLPSDDTVAAALATAALETWPRAFPSQNEELTSFIARARCLAAWLPELELPPLSEEQLKSLLPDLCFGRRSFAELRQAPWLAAVKGLFTYPQLQVIEQEAPERIEVPSGSRIALEYEPGQPPILKVRIQELFGLAATPRIARGRVGVLLHLLAPNMRPEQITPDLASFWKNTYPQVRKDLRGRYPKHSWPDDPLTAEPMRGAKRRG